MGTICRSFRNFGTLRSDFSTAIVLFYYYTLQLSPFQDLNENWGKREENTNGFLRRDEVYANVIETKPPCYLNYECTGHITCLFIRLSCNATTFSIISSRVSSITWPNLCAWIAIFNHIVAFVSHSAQITFRLYSHFLNYSKSPFTFYFCLLFPVIVEIRFTDSRLFNGDLGLVVQYLISEFPFSVLISSAVCVYSRNVCL